MQHISGFVTSGAPANINNTSTGCGNALGYTNYCNKYIGALQGQIITATVNVFTPSIMGIKCWIDWDQSLTFDAGEVVGFTPSQVTNSFVFSFTVPLAQASGNYKLRLKAINFTNGPSIDPCLTYSQGETEDYGVVIGVPAPGPTTIIASQTTVCPVTVVGLTASGGGPYLWSNGQTQPNTSIAVSQNTVMYISVQQAGCAVVNAVSLTAAPPVTVSTLPFVNICMGSTATLTASGATSYTWNPGGVVAPSIAVSPTVTTVYFVTGTNGFCFQNVNTTVTPMPQLTINNTQSICCAGSTVNMSANGALNYTWMPGNINSPFATFSPTTTGTYTLFGQSGMCTSSKTFQVIVPPSPTIIPFSNINPVCIGAMVILSATGGNSYTWNPGGIGSTVVVTPSAQLVYTLSGSDGTCSATAFITQSVMPGPSVTATSSSISICSGNSTTLTASGTPFYLWSNGNSNSSIVITPSITTSYTVTGILGLCTGSAVVVQSVIPTPSITTLSSSNIICVGNTATLNANGASSYSWLPTGSGSSIVINPTITSTYTVIGNNGPCTASASITQSVELCTAIGEKSLVNSELKLYPNPFNNQITLSGINFEKLIITDLMGKQIMILRDGPVENINTTTWLPGLYFFIFKINSEIKTIKVIKN